LEKYYTKIEIGLLYEFIYIIANIAEKMSKSLLKTSYCIVEEETSDVVREIGVDEAGRGPMFGRVYTAAVVLPADSESFDHALMKDSKKFHSEAKIQAAAAYIKEKAIAWSIAYSSETVIDEVNIRNATHQAMHKAIAGVIGKLQAKGEIAGGQPPDAKGEIAGGQPPDAKGEIAGGQPPDAKGGCGGIPQEILLLVDGNDFTPFIHEATKKRLQHVCIEGGDNAYSCIAAASILAKVARDDYIKELCIAEPSLIERYDLLKNKGYGTKKHMDGIKQHGITPWHRKTFGLCKTFV
jgi:ribonuclease HII